MNLFFPHKRNIAKVASQVHAFQENPYTFSPDPKLQAHLKQRIARFSGADVAILAADNRANFHQIPGEKHSRKIQDNPGAGGGRTLASVMLYFPVTKLIHL